MADRDRTEMEREIHERLTIPKRARVVCRSGRPTDLGDLSIANPDASRAIVVLAPEGNDPDVAVLKTILALAGRPGRRAEPYRVVAEVREPANAGVARLIGQDHVHLILGDDLLARIIAQTCRQSGLSVVYQELLDFAGQEFHVEALPELVGRTFGDAVQLVTGGVPIGIVRDDHAHLNPPRDRVIDAADKLVVLAEDHGSTRVATTPAVVDVAAIASPAPHEEIPERILVLGWNGRGGTIVSQLDSYVAPGSELLAVSAVGRVVRDIDGLKGLRHLKASGRAADTTHRNLLDDLDVASFDHVVVLCESDDHAAESADARTLVTLLHLRDIGTRSGRDFSIVSEMLDVRDRELAEVARADDFIVSARVLSLLLAQVAETPELAEVFRDLFDAGGSEVYLREAAEYVALGGEVSFATIQEAAQRRGEVAMGYRLAVQADDKAAAYGVVLNPGRDARVSLALADRVIVLAEE
jgi:voltage-gated potassium channel Kch